MESLDKIVRHINEKEAIKLTTSLIKVASVTGNEGPIAEFLSKELNMIGLPTEYLEAVNGRPNVICHFPAERESGGLILVGHIDTVPVGDKDGKLWMTDPFAGVVKDGRIYGVGSSDMKGGIASILLAVRGIIRETSRGLKRRLTLIFCVDEECGSFAGMRHVVQQMKFRESLAMAAEPTNMAIQGCFKGKEWIEIETRGKAAHPSSPTRGVNAVHHMADIICRIRKKGFRCKKHRFLGSFTINCGAIEGGTSINTIPNLCRAKLEVRTVPGQTGNAIKKQIRGYINELRQTDPTVDASFRITDRKDPLEIPSKSSVFSRVQEGSVKAIGKRLEFGTMGVASGDLYYIWKKYNIPGIIFGPGDIGLAHSPNEFVKVRNIVSASRCYAAFIQKFCND